MINYGTAIIQDTIVAIATPAGEGAIGIIRLSGSNSIQIANSLFKGSNLLEANSHTVHFGRLVHNDSIIDEVLISVFRSPKSYTGEDIVEISCHGSQYILQKVVELCIGNGARSANPGEFTLRAFLNGKMDLSQAEAVADLISSDSKTAHKLAIKQMRGAISKKIKELRDELIRFTSLIELELDFSEEDVEFADREQFQKLINEIQGLSQDLIQSFELGNAIKKGIFTVIAGRPNAGKSTLLNALIGEDRAIVSDIEGTTRDTIEEVININGIQFRLIDTAGIRDASDVLESIGIEKTYEKIKQAAIILYIFDVNVIEVEDVLSDVKQLGTNGAQLLLIGNKIDLSTDHLKKFESLERVRFISSKDSIGLSYLKNSLFEIVLGSTKSIANDSAIISNLRHYQSLAKAKKALSKVKIGIENSISGELLSLDIREALDSLGEITGEVTNDDILGSIFSEFCIGK